VVPGAENVQWSDPIMATYLEAQKVKEEHWRQLAGDLLPEMLRSPEEAMRQLRHPSAGVRKVAIQVASDHWKLYGKKAFAQVCEELTASDEDPLVRHAALLALGVCHEGTDDLRIGAMLAAIVADKGQSDNMRLAAYLSLLSVRRPVAKLKLSAYFGLKDVDWGIVSDSLNLLRPVVPVDRLAAVMAHLPAERAAAYRLYTEGLEASERGEYDKSVQYFSEALGLEPNAVGARIGRAHASVALGAHDKAIADFTRAIELNPSSLVALRERARVHRLMGAIDLAERDERNAAAIEEAKNPHRD